MATMAEVIVRAIKEHQRLSDGWASGGDKRPVPQYEHIAAAVAVHMLSEAAIAHAVQAACRAEGGADICQFPECGCTGRPITISAAIRAALGEHEGVGR